ncbi:MAG: amidohydrolase family protein [Candidatus Wenzhouxiangella sp. M2_3B_020]
MRHEITRSPLRVFCFIALLLPAMIWAQSPVLIEDVTIVDVRDGTLQPGRTVLIDDGRIAAVGEVGAAERPDDARIVDGSGHYLMPGLWDMHVHSVTNRGWHFPMLLVHGVTAVRNMHSTEENPLAKVAAVKAELASGELMGPRFIANGPIVDGPPGIWPNSVLVDGPEDAAGAVERLEAGGADFIKIYDHLSRESFQAVTERARSLGIPVDGHLPVALTPQEAASAGMRTIEHGSGITMGCSREADTAREGFEELRKDPPSFMEGQMAFLRLNRLMNDSQDDALCAEVVEAYRQHGVAATPTLVMRQGDTRVSEMLADDTVLAMLPAEVVARWQAMTQSDLAEQFARLTGPLLQGSIDRTRILHEGGVTLLAGTDIGNPLIAPGYSLHQELGLLVEAGLTPHEALQAATINPASVLDLSESMGQIRAGFEADLVLLRQNPLEKIENVREIEAVVTRGRYLDRKTLDDMVAATR